MFTEIHSSILKSAVILGLPFVVSACVSNTLSQQNTQPQSIAAQSQPTYDPAQREQAIAEIRAKAQNSTSGELTHAYAIADGPTQPLSPEEQAAKIAELERNAAANGSAVSDAELDAKQRSINELRSKAKSHYNNAISTIAN